MAKNYIGFSDYLEEKDGFTDSEYTDGPLSVVPPQKPSKGKKDKPLPYSAASDDDGSTLVSGDKENGLADLGSPGINPNVSSLGEKPQIKIKNMGKPAKMPGKLTTEEFVKKTAGMNNEEFAKFILEANKTDTKVTTVTDLYGNEFTPDPEQSMQYVAGIVLGNDNMMRKFIMEVKRRGGMNQLMEEVMDHSEGHQSIVNCMEDPEVGKSRINRFANHMNDSFISLNGNPEDDIFPESAGPSIDDIFGSEETHDDKSDDDHDDQSEPEIIEPKKMKEGNSRRYKDCAAHHLINELHNYPHFADHMKKRCVS